VCKHFCFVPVVTWRQWDAGSCPQGWTSPWVLTRAWRVGVRDMAAVSTTWTDMCSTPPASVTLVCVCNQDTQSLVCIFQFYYIRKIVSLYNSIERNWSIFFDIGCVKIHVMWYRVCKQNRTTFVLLLFTMMTLRTKNPIIPAFLWRHNVCINYIFNLASILTLFYTINLYISSNMLLEVFHIDHFVQNPF